MKKIKRNLKILLGILHFIVGTTMFSQTLTQPVLDLEGGIACADTPGKSFKVSFGATEMFAADNKFTIELSEPDGTWDTPTNVGTITTANSLSSFNSTFLLPDEAFGTNYKIRLVATSPAMISPDSEPFQAYDKFIGTLELNGFNNVTLCDGNTTDLTITNTSKKRKYDWYRDDVLVATTTEAVLENVSQAGTYKVEIDYGDCGSTDSTRIDVIVLGEVDKQIQGGSVIQVCGNQAHTFEAVAVYDPFQDPIYTYNWYLNTVLVHSSNVSSTYTTPEVGQLGVYYLEIDTGTCITSSSEVELTQESTPTLTITDETPLLKVLLEGESVELSINVTGSAAYTIEWYRNDKKLSGASGDKLDINQPGSYFANVIEKAVGGCDVVQASRKMNLLSVKSFEPIIITDDDYEACKVTGVDLELQLVNVIAEDDNLYVLTTDQLKLLNYQWTVDGVNIPSATSDKLTRSSHTQIGVYELEVSLGFLTDFPSNELDIKLIGKAPVLSSIPSSNSLCPGGEITYTINNLITGYTYEWFKDTDTIPIASDVSDFVVTEIGTYSLKMTGFGCEEIIETVEVVLFDASAIIVTPSEKVILVLGETEVIKVSGAESYAWYEGEGTAGMLLSTSETLDVNKLGFYTVVATVGACGVEKIIEVIEQDDQVIVPNVLTPNGDGINDTWRISNKYAFQPTVIIQIYNSDGKEILKISDYQNDWPLQDLGGQRIFYYKIIREDILIKAGTISVLD